MLMQLDTIAYETNYNGMQLLTGRELGNTTTYFDSTAPPQMNTGVNIVPPANGGMSSLGVSGYTTPNYIGEHKIDLSGVSGLSQSIDGQGLSIMCSACGQFNSIKFDASLPAGTGQYYPDPNGGQADAFVIGVQGLTTSSQVEKAIFDGIQSAKGFPSTSTAVPIGNHNTTIEKRSDGYYLTRTGSGGGSHFVLYNGFKGELATEQAYHPWQNMYVQGDTKSSLETRIQLSNTTLSILFPEANSDWDIVPTPADYPVEWSSDYANLTDAEKVRKWEDEEWSYPRKGAIASGSCVLNRTNANKFLEDIDQALKYLLHAATSLGAQCQRMDAMGENIVTGNENTQASESTIRDADMAREMVAYTKANVIFQSSQSMLAQANQSLSSVLGLLQ
ncbi:MAG: flagellin [Selenomonadaceae bacterium]|nr:flagellin [Selenomonadaceae bacterium]